MSRPPIAATAAWIRLEGGDRRQRILAAALAVFSEVGFREAEVQTIAERAGVGKATIYKYFEGKVHLFLSLVDEGLAAIRDQVLADLIGPGQPLERLERAVRHTLRFLERNRPLLRIIIQEAGEFMGEIQRKYLLVVEQNLQLAEAFFAVFREQGGFRTLPIRQVVQLLVNLLIGTAYTWALNGDGSLEEEGVAYFHILLAGLRNGT